ncbi:hypothetical protein [Leptospirillum ferriphilum]|uniref:hypothetical protein n=1 Tax=Leptospirillum ferriphilum TaxID=178606 RepID=UPI00031A8EF0|nr:hypothetical protein [Leptospirillum ferriphilum]
MIIGHSFLKEFRQRTHVFEDASGPLRPAEDSPASADNPPSFGHPFPLLTELYRITMRWNFTIMRELSSPCRVPERENVSRKARRQYADGGAASLEAKRSGRVYDGRGNL